MLYSTYRIRSITRNETSSAICACRARCWHQGLTRVRLLAWSTTAEHPLTLYMTSQLEELSFVVHASQDRTPLRTPVIILYWGTGQRLGEFQR
jgi:hypothetical protein